MINNSIAFNHKDVVLNRHTTMRKEQEVITINIANDFSSTPGPRYRRNGKFSGEEFLETLLNEKFLQAERENKKLVVNVDGLAGYPSSFIDGSFGELIRKEGRVRVTKVLQVEAIEDTFALEEINYCLHTADKKRN